MDFEIAIPSYQRAKRCKETTLAYLLSQDIDPKHITIFVKNEEERKAYAEEISGVALVICNNKDLNEKKTFINQYYPLGTKIVNMDDDIKEVVFLHPNQRLVPTIVRMFQLLREENCSVWGVYPVHTSNLYYLKDRVAIGLNFCIGQFHGYINTGTRFPPDFIGKEDKWLSLNQYVLEGKTLRYEGAVCKTRVFAPGGLTEYRASADLEASARRLAALFPTLTKFQIKKTGEADVIFKRIPRTFRPLWELPPGHERTSPLESNSVLDDPTEE